MISAAPPERSPAPDWLPLDQLAEVELTSENPAHPIEGALSPGSESGWRAGAPGEQTIRLTFEPPRTLRRIRVVVEEREQARTQQFVLRVSANGQWREVARQQFNFSPSGATREQEDYRLELPPVAVLELEITPDIGGGDACASLRQLWVA
jgi:hypothetical protein